MATFRGSLSAANVSWKQLAAIDFRYSVYAATDISILSGDGFKIQAELDSIAPFDIIEKDVDKFAIDSVGVVDSIPLFDATKNAVEILNAIDVLEMEVYTERSDTFSVTDVAYLEPTKGYADSVLLTETFVTEGTKNITDGFTVVATVALQSDTYDEIDNVAFASDVFLLNVEKGFSETVVLSDEILLIPLREVRRYINGYALDGTTFG